MYYSLECPNNHTSTTASNSRFLYLLFHCFNVLLAGLQVCILLSFWEKTYIWHSCRCESWVYQTIHLEICWAESHDIVDNVCFILFIRSNQHSRQEMALRLADVHRSWLGGLKFTSLARQMDSSWEWKYTWRQVQKDIDTRIQKRRRTNELLETSKDDSCDPTV